MSLHPGSTDVLSRIVLVCGAITAGAGALILVGWAIGSDALTAMGTGYIPAPNTALLFVLLGSAVLVREVWPDSRIIQRAAAAAALLSVVLAGVTLIGFRIGLSIDDWLFSTTRMLGEVPMGRMSPVTAFCFALAGASVLLLECRVGVWAAILGTLITLVGSVSLMGYGFGAPLLYGGSVIPVALPTSLALVALGIGLTAAAGPHTWPLNIWIGPSTRARLLRALLPTVVLLALINDWISAVLLEHSDPGVVLTAAMTAISFLLVVGYAVTRVSGTIGDAIDRTQAELARAVDALRASEGKYRRIYDSLQDVYVETDLEGTILEISPQVETLSCGQYRREDLLGKSVNAFYGNPERRAAFLRTLTLLGTVKDFESRFLNRDGSVVPCSLSAMIRLDAEGRPKSIVSILRDISRRKGAEESLRESEERLRAIFEGALDGILVADAESKKFVTGNPAICRMLGYTLQEIVRIGVSDIHPKQDLPRVMAEFERQQRGEMQLVADFPVMRKDGSVFYADIQSAPIRLGGGNCLLGHFRDVTERKQAEDATRESERRYRRLFDNLLEGFAYCRMLFENGLPLDFVYVEVNPAFEQLTKLKNVVGKKVTEVIPGIRESNPELFERYGRVAATGKPETFATYIAPLELWLSISVFCPEQGYFVAVFENITERKQAEDALYAAKNLLDKIFTTLDEAVLVVDPNTSTVIACNPAVERIFGYGERDVIGRNTEHMHVDRSYYERFGRELFRALEVSGVFHTEFQMRRKDGSVFPTENTVTEILDGLGRRTSVVSVVRDITERKQAEAAMRNYTERLQMLSRRVIDAHEDERALISRELHDQTGQHLSALKLNLQVLRRNPKVRPVAPQLDESIEMIDDILQQVRTLSYELRPAQLDDLGLATTLRTYAERIVGAAGLRLHFALQELPKGPAHGGITCFRVAQEAFTNVVRHAGAKNVWVDLSCENGQLRLAIRDDGKGCDMAAVRELERHGESMGMLNMQERTAIAGGTIDFNSAPGKGMAVRGPFPLPPPPRVRGN